MYLNSYKQGKVLNQKESYRHVNKRAIKASNWLTNKLLSTYYMLFKQSL